MTCFTKVTRHPQQHIKSYSAILIDTTSPMPDAVSPDRFVVADTLRRLEAFVVSVAVVIGAWNNLCYGCALSSIICQLEASFVSD